MPDESVGFNVNVSVSGVEGLGRIANELSKIQNLTISAMRTTAGMASETLSQLAKGPGVEQALAAPIGAAAGALGEFASGAGSVEAAAQAMEALKASLIEILNISGIRESLVFGPFETGLTGVLGVLDKLSPEARAAAIAMKSAYDALAAFSKSMSEIGNAIAPAMQEASEAIRQTGQAAEEASREAVEGAAQAAQEAAAEAGQAAAQAGQEVAQQAAEGAAKAGEQVAQATAEVSDSAAKTQNTLKALAEWLVSTGVLSKEAAGHFMELAKGAAIEAKQLEITAKALGISRRQLLALIREANNLGKARDTTSELTNEMRAMALTTEDLSGIIKAFGLESSISVDRFREILLREARAMDTANAAAQKLGASQALISRATSEAGREIAESNRRYRFTELHSWEAARAIDILTSASQGLMFGISAANMNLTGMSMGLYFLRTAVIKVWAPLAAIGFASSLAAKAFNLLKEAAVWLGKTIMAGLRAAFNFVIGALKKLGEAMISVGRWAVGLLVRGLGILKDRLVEVGGAAQDTIRQFSAIAGSAKAGAANWMAASTWAVRYGMDIKDVEEALVSLWRGGILDQQGEALKTAIALSSAWNIELSEAVDVLREAIGTTEGNVEALRDYGLVLDKSVNSMDFASRRAEVLKQVFERFGESAEERVMSIGGALQRVRSAAQMFWGVLLEPIASRLAAPFINFFANIVASLAQTAAAMWSSSSVGKAWMRTMEAATGLLEEFSAEINILANMLRLGLVVAFELLRRALAAVVSLLQRFFSWLRNIRTTLSQSSGSAKALASALQFLAQSFKNLTFTDLLQQAKNLLYNLFPNLDKIIDAIKRFVDMFIWLLREFLLKPGLELLRGIITGFSAFIPLIAEKVNWILAELEPLKDALKPLAEAVQAAFGAIGVVLGAILGTLAVLVMTGIQTIILGLEGRWSEIPALWEQTWKELGITWDNVWRDEINPRLETAKSKFLEWIGRTFGEGAKEKAEGAISGLGSTISQLLTNVATVITGKEMRGASIGDIIRDIGLALLEVVMNLPEQISQMENLRKVLDDIGIATGNILGAITGIRSGSSELLSLSERLGLLTQVIDRIAWAFEPITRALADLTGSIAGARSEMEVTSGALMKLFYALTAIFRILIEFPINLWRTIAALGRGAKEIYDMAEGMIARAFENIANIIRWQIPVLEGDVQDQLRNFGVSLGIYFGDLILSAIQVVLKLVLGLVGETLGQLAGLLTDLFAPLFPELEGVGDKIRTFMSTLDSDIESSLTDARENMRNKLEELAVGVEDKLNEKSPQLGEAAKGAFGPMSPMALAALNGANLMLQSMGVVGPESPILQDVLVFGGLLGSNLDAALGPGSEAQRAALGFGDTFYRAATSPVQQLATDLPGQLNGLGSTITSFYSTNGPWGSALRQAEAEFCSVFGPTGRIGTTASGFQFGVLTPLGTGLRSFNDSTWDPILSMMQGTWDTNFARDGLMATSLSDWQKTVVPMMSETSSSLSTSMLEALGLIESKWRFLFGTEREEGFLETIWKRLTNSLKSIWNEMRVPLEALGTALHAIESDLRTILRLLDELERGIGQVPTGLPGVPVPGPTPTAALGPVGGTNNITVEVRDNTFLTQQQLSDFADMISSSIAGDVRLRRLPVSI